MASSNGASAPATHQHVFSATYQSPSNAPFSVSQNLAAPDVQAIDQRATYLRDLRAAVVDAQERINKELTARMEEDKARDAAGAGHKVADVDEAKEEENYGEEVVEEEE